MLKRGLFACAVLGVATSAFAGARIDLRPAHPAPYAPNETVDVDVYLVDTGNAQGDISFRGLFLDTADTSGTITFTDPDGAGTLTANNFLWTNPLSLGAVFPQLPNTSWVYPLSVPNPAFQITLPNDSEVKIGDLSVNVGASGGTLDVTNHDEPNDNFGARADFGFGLTPSDPVTTWRAFTGELTGGTLAMPVPEPTTLVLLGAGAIAAIRRRRTA